MGARLLRTARRAPTSYGARSVGPAAPSFGRSVGAPPPSGYRSVGAPPPSGYRSVGAPPPSGYRRSSLESPSPSPSSSPRARSVGALPIALFCTSLSLTGCDAILGLDDIEVPGPAGTGGAGGGGGTTGGTNTGGGGTMSTGGTSTGGGSTGGGAGVCGDQKKDGIEECDDGAANADNADCTSTCKNATCGDGLDHTMGAAPLEECDDGTNNSDEGACTLECKNASCGDGHLWKGMEECDDGNTMDGDGCSAACKAVCGDGLVVGAEECEDGNLTDGDGCSALCKIESACGNGRVDPDEVCDGGLGCMDMCNSIDPATTCGTATPITPGALEMGVRTTHFEGDTDVMQVLDLSGLLNPGCTDPHQARLFTYKTGDTGSIVFAQTKDGTVDGLATFADTTLWAYRDCLNKRAEEACSDDNVPGSDNYSSIQTGYLPPHTTLFLVVGGHSDLDHGKFLLDIVEQPVTLLFGTPFDADLGGMTVTDSNNDGTWGFCDGFACGNTTRSWSGRGFAQINDSTDLSHVDEDLTTPSFDTSALNTVYVQYALDFSQKGGGGVETFTLLDSPDGSTYTPIFSNTVSTGGGLRERTDVSGTATTTTTYSVQLRYDDAAGQGAFVKVDDLYLYGY